MFSSANAFRVLPPLQITLSASCFTYCLICFMFYSCSCVFFSSSVWSILSLCYPSCLMYTQNHLNQALASSVLSLEMALLILSQEADKLEGMKKVKFVVSVFTCTILIVRKLLIIIQNLCFYSLSPCCHELLRLIQHLKLCG